MKRTATVVVVLLALAFVLVWGNPLGSRAEAVETVSTKAAAAKPSDLEIDKFVKSILEQNEISRKAARKLHVDSVIKVSGHGEFRLAKPAGGKNDCIWYLAAKLLQDQSPAPTWVLEKQSVVETVIPAVTAPAPMPTKSEPSFFTKLWGWIWGAIMTILGWLWWLLKLLLWLALVALALLVAWLLLRVLRRVARIIIRRAQESERLNPNRYPPVVRNGLSADPATAHQKIEQIVRDAYPSGPAVVRSERGHLIHRSGQRYLFVKMHFGDGQDRTVKFDTYEPVWRITLANGDVLFARASCGNLISGRFQLPRGWEFRLEPGMSYSAPDPEPVRVTVPVNPPSPPKEPTATTLVETKTRRSVEVNLSGDKIVVNTDGDLPTKIEQEGDKVTILFPRKEDKV
jgi:hypothetical protein